MCEKKEKSANINNRIHRQTFLCGGMRENCKTASEWYNNGLKEDIYYVYALSVSMNNYVQQLYFDIT